MKTQAASQQSCEQLRFRSCGVALSGSSGKTPIGSQSAESAKSVDHPWIRPITESDFVAHGIHRKHGKEGRVDIGRIGGFTTKYESHEGNLPVARSRSMHRTMGESASGGRDVHATCSVGSMGSPASGGQDSHATSYLGVSVIQLFRVSLAVGSWELVPPRSAG